MAGSAVAFFFLSAIALLCLCHHLLLPDPAAAGPVVVVARAHRRGRAGRHHHHHASSSSNNTPSSSGIPDIKTFRDMLDRLPADDWSWSAFDAELGPLDRYFGPGGPLGVRQRLVYLFAIFDRSPKDGGVSLAELEAWLLRQAAARLQAVARREMANHDGDGVVKLHEYIEHGKSWGWLHKFASADADGDGSLNAAEFNDFLHPEDSSQDKVQLWLLEHKLSEMDHDGDGRLSLEEFIDQSHVFDHHISVAHHEDEDEGDHDLRVPKLKRSSGSSMPTWTTI